MTFSCKSCCVQQYHGVRFWLSKCIFSERLKGKMDSSRFWYTITSHYKNILVIDFLSVTIFTSEVCERRPEFILLCRLIYSTGCFSFLIIFRQLLHAARNNTSLLDVQRPGWLRIWRRETALDGKYWMFNSIIHSFGIVYLLRIVICEYLTFSVEVSIFSSSTVHVVN